MVPALLTMMSIAANDRAFSKSSWAPEDRERSAWIAVARRPFCWIFLQVSAAGCELPWQITSAPASASPMAIAAPSPVDDPVTSAVLPERLKRAWTTLFSAGLQARTRAAELGLNVHHTVLPVFHFAMRRHGPQDRKSVV